VIMMEEDVYLEHVLGFLFPAIISGSYGLAEPFFHVLGGRVGVGERGGGEAAAAAAAAAA